MKFDATRTIGIFVALIAVGIVGLLAMNVMPVNVTLMMVLPSMIVAGLVFMFLGVKHGEYRAAR